MKVKLNWMSVLNYYQLTSDDKLKDDETNAIGLWLILLLVSQINI